MIKMKSHTEIKNLNYAHTKKNVVCARVCVCVCAECCDVRFMSSVRAVLCYSTAQYNKPYHVKGTVR